MRYEGLELNEDLRLERRTHRTKRFVRWSLLVLVLAGLAGLFGNGPCSERMASSADGQLLLHYDAIVRRTVESTLRIEVAPGGGASLELRLPRDYLGSVRMQAVRPLPLRHSMSGEEVVFVFERDADATTHAEVVIKPRHPGLFAGAVAIAGGGRVEFRQLCLP